MIEINGNVFINRKELLETMQYDWLTDADFKVYVMLVICAMYEENKKADLQRGQLTITREKIKEMCHFDYSLVTVSKIIKRLKDHEMISVFYKTNYMVITIKDYNKVTNKPKIKNIPKFKPKAKPKEVIKEKPKEELFYQ